MKVHVIIIMYLVLTVTVFYTCYIILLKSLVMSLVDAAFVPFIGVIAWGVQSWLEKENAGFMKRTAIELISVNFVLFTLQIAIFSNDFTSYLISGVTFTLVYGGISYMRYKRIYR